MNWAMWVLFIPLLMGWVVAIYLVGAGRTAEKPKQGSEAIFTIFLILFFGGIQTWLLLVAVGVL
jgi:hypothetical protein